MPAKSDKKKTKPKIKDVKPAYRLTKPYHIGFFSAHLNRMKSELRESTKSIDEFTKAKGEKAIIRAQVKMEMALIGITNNYILFLKHIKEMLGPRWDSKL